PGQRFRDPVIRRGSACAVARLAIAPGEPGVALGIENAALGEPNDECAVGLVLGKGRAAVGGDRDEVILGLGVGVVDHVIVRQDLLVVAVLAAFGVCLHSLAEALAEVRGLGDVDIGVAARQAVSQE